ncbi:hypothetical protein L227DRAFT_310576 [Lentinus tigrinus ALCF2SS1-6]|uniref:Uncharacterized protein n=1 Tax=Lentinus tigrinus ALCF2SS1-6 TaxID=1328759 RepID=A0A5C2RU33_9APHY|nr:hypothetical protein L227DRAFT_310576 [Lentinus tigrinus ALCF2SS1-6]
MRQWIVSEETSFRGRTFVSPAYDPPPGGTVPHPVLNEIIRAAIPRTLPLLFLVSTGSGGRTRIHLTSHAQGTVRHEEVEGHKRPL